MRKLMLCAAAFALLAGTAVGLRARTAEAGQQLDTLTLRAIHAYRERTWHFQVVMGVRRTPFRFAALPLDRLRSVWQSNAHRAARRFHAGPPHRRAWLCIHRYEGSWRDRGAPYYGGLQMDLTFQRRYGALLLRTKGTADHWTPLEQMWIAEKAYRGRGFGPWPNTARYCGLL